LRNREEREKINLGGHGNIRWRIKFGEGIEGKKCEKLEFYLGGKGDDTYPRKKSISLFANASTRLTFFVPMNTIIEKGGTGGGVTVSPVRT